jgi:hypothetical protein
MHLPVEFLGCLLPCTHPKGCGFSAMILPRMQLQTSAHDLLTPHWFQVQTLISDAARINTFFTSQFSAFTPTLRLLI